MSKQWFDAHNTEHCKAYRHLQHIGSWPDGFELHDVAAAGALWQVLLMGKMTTAWIDRMLEKAEKND